MYRDIEKYRERWRDGEIEISRERERLRDGDIDIPRYGLVHRQVGR